MHKIKPWLRFIEGDEGGSATDAASADDESAGQENQEGGQEGEAVTWESLFKGEDPKDVRKQLEHAREWERRAKANKDAADKLKQIEDAGKSDDQKVTDELAEAQRVATAAQVEVRRYRMAAKYGLTDEQADLYLTDPDEDRMESQAQGLAEMAKKPKRTSSETTRDRTAPAPTLKSGADLYARVKANL